MEHGVKQFARKILAIHLALLAILLAGVSFASRQVYRSAKDQALLQARDRQNLLATQTARAVENFYEAILSDLELAQPSAEDSGDPEGAATKPNDSAPSDLEQGVQAMERGARALENTGPDGRGRGRGQFQPSGRRGTGGRGGPPPFVPGAEFARLLVRQLQNRSHLIVVDRTQNPLRARTFGSPPNAPPTAFEADVLAKMGDWLATVQKPTISRFFRPAIEGIGVNLVALPVPKTNTLLVAAVGVRPVEHEFLEQLGQRSTTDAYLVDETGTIMAASVQSVVGSPLDAANDPQLQHALASVAASDGRGTTEINHPFKLGGVSSEPVMLTAEPIHVLDKQWMFVVTSPLSEVDSVVKDLSRKAIIWAAFVALSMTAILVSTATQLIRSRARMERVRHEALQSELRQARQIQLAWLPGKTRLATAGLDIASINRPASHISGDFYNFFDLPDGTIAVVIGDVTGHGIAAAFLMATTQMLVRTTLARLLDPGQCLEEVNRQLCVQAFNGQFVTMQICVIDPRSGQMQIANAGHPPPLIGEGEQFKQLPLDPQLVLGIDPTAEFPAQRFVLPPGGKLLLYTDGVVEAENLAGERLRAEGLRKSLTGDYEAASGLIDAALSIVNSFSQGRELRDDLTMVAVQLQPQETKRRPPQLALATRSTN